MKANLTCKIVQDLLPNYIEELTSDETNIALEEHLNICDGCKEIYEQMKVEICNTEEIPRKELKFLKKIKRTRIIAAILCIVLALTFSFLIYTSEYKFANDKGELSIAITEYTSHSRHPIDAYVLETKEIDGVLVATFKDQTKQNINGVAVLNKGINQRYRIIRANVKTSEYSSVIQVYPVNIKDKKYYVVSGYNLSDKVKSYGLDFDAYLNPGYLSKDRVRESIKFDVINQQFLEIYYVEELVSMYESSIEETLYNPRLVAASMYDADSMEITDDFKIQESYNEVSYGIGKAELFLLYVFIAIVLGLGYVFTRYFLTD